MAANAFVQAASHRRVGYVELLLETWTYTADTVEATLLHAVAAGQVDAVRALLAWRGPAGACVDIGGEGNGKVLNAALTHHYPLDELLAWRHPRDPARAAGTASPSQLLHAAGV